MVNIEVVHMTIKELLDLYKTIPFKTLGDVWAYHYDISIPNYNCPNIMYLLQHKDAEEFRGVYKTLVQSPRLTLYIKEIPKEIDNIHPREDTDDDDDDMNSTDVNKTRYEYIATTNSPKHYYNQFPFVSVIRRDIDILGEVLPKCYNYVDVVNHIFIPWRQYSKRVNMKSFFTNKEYRHKVFKFASVYKYLHLETWDRHDIAKDYFTIKKFSPDVETKANILYGELKKVNIDDLIKYVEMKCLMLMIDDKRCQTSSDTDYDSDYDSDYDIYDNEREYNYDKAVDDVKAKLYSYFNTQKSLDHYHTVLIPKNKTNTPTTSTIVYLITFPNDIVKVGKHSGPIKALTGRYNTHTPEYSLDYFETNDYTNTEVAIHKTLKSLGLHDHLEFFKDNDLTHKVWHFFKEINTG